MTRATKSKTTIRIRPDQYDALLKIATKQQQKICFPVTVGMLIRQLIDKELASG
jgi:hypothetical protein